MFFCPFVNRNETICGGRADWGELEKSAEAKCAMIVVKGCKMCRRPIPLDVNEKIGKLEERGNKEKKDN
jgi:hypothetical protein